MGRLRLCLGAALQFGAVHRHEIDVFQVQRWEAAVARHITDDAPQEGEHHAGAFDHQEGMKLFVWYVFNVEHPDIVQLKQKERLLCIALVPRCDVQLHRYFELVFLLALFAVLSLLAWIALKAVFRKQSSGARIVTHDINEN